MTEKECVRKLTQVQRLLEEVYAGIGDTVSRHRSPETVEWQQSLLAQANSLVNEALLRGPIRH